MRVVKFRSTPVAVPFVQPEVWAFGQRTGMVSVLLEVETDEGLVGLGEAAAYPSADIIEAVLRSVEPLVVGQEVFAIERIMKRINIVGTWHHVQSTSPAIAAVEMALWDIVGKASGQPIVNLFGGKVRDEVEYFYYLSRNTSEEMAKDAAKGYEAGYRCFYLKAGSNHPSEDIERVEAIDAAIGDDAGIRVDSNESWSAAAAIRILTDMNRFKLELAEQPVSGRNLAEMAYVRSRLPVPLLANEASWTRWHHLEIIKHAAADVVSVDNQMDGGLANLKVGCAMNEVAGIPVLKHSLGELGIATYAGCHVLASAPNNIFANQAYGSLLADDIIEGASPLPYSGGMLRVPAGPGLGVTLDTERVQKYAEAYRANPDGYAFRDSGSLTDTPVMPKF